MKERSKERKKKRDKKKGKETAKKKEKKKISMEERKIICPHWPLLIGCRDKGLQ